MLGGNLRWTSIPSRGVAILVAGFVLQKLAADPQNWNGITTVIYFIVIVV